MKVSSANVGVIVALVVLILGLGGLAVWRHSRFYGTGIGREGRRGWLRWGS